MPSSERRKFLPGLLPRAWLYVAVAVALGIALFLLIWARQRGSDDFYRVDAARQTSTGQAFEPLPVPDTGGSGEGDARTPQAPQDQAEGGEGESARIEEPVPAPQPAPAPVAPAPAQPSAQQATAESAPVPISSPAPTYPPAALRRGETGEALLRVHVGPDGVPYAIDLVRGSGSRLLDRAATDAVRKWRFRPALRDGQPVDGSVQVPIAFNAR
jgi:protein TonB